MTHFSRHTFLILNTQKSTIQWKQLSYGGNRNHMFSSGLFYRVASQVWSKTRNIFNGVQFNVLDNRFIDLLKDDLWGHFFAQWTMFRLYYQYRGLNCNYYYKVHWLWPVLLLLFQVCKKHLTELFFHKWSPSNYKTQRATGICNVNQLYLLHLMVNLLTVLSRIEGVKVSFTREMDFICTTT